MQNMLGLIPQAAVVGGCVAICSYAVSRLEARRVKEMGEWSSLPGVQPSFPRWKRIAIVLCLFALGIFAGDVLFGFWNGDPIFRQYVPWFGSYEILLSGIMLTSCGLVVCGVSFPKTFWRKVVLALAVLALSFVVHLADAFSFWGHGMSFVACARGFSNRCFITAVHVVLLVPLLSVSILLILCTKSTRRDLSLRNLTCGRFLGNSLRLTVWFGLLGLLAYETLVLLWLNIVVR